MTITEGDVINKWTIICFVASCVVCLFILVLYWRCCVKKDTDGASKTGKGTFSSTNQRIATEWNNTISALGVDLGSYETKTYAFDNGQVKLQGTSRSIVTMYEEGFHFGEVGLAKEAPETTFFSLTRDMAFGADVTLTLEDVSLKPFQACGILLKWLIGDRPRPPLVAVGIPPYLNHFTNDLYLAAMAAGIGRFFCFRQSAALMAGMLRYRKSDTGKNRFARHVVFVDAGRSGISAYLCEVRDTAASMKKETHRFEGFQEMERAMVMDLAEGLDESLREDPHFLASIVEAAAELRYEFASIPAYLMSTAKKKSKTKVTENITVEMDRERFTEILEIAKDDVELVAEEILGWLQDEGIESSCDLVLSGNGFKLRDLRAPIERLVPWKTVIKDKIAVAQGLAVLAAMQHPRYNDQRFDVDPLYEAMTLEETGLRPRVEDEGRTGSILSPLLGGRTGSGLNNSKRRSNRGSDSTYGRQNSSQALPATRSTGSLLGGSAPTGRGIN